MDYKITKDGEIYKGQIKKKLSKLKSGYLITRIGNKMSYVHRLVAEQYIPNPNNKPQVNHINGIKDDNRVENLEWATRSENMKHAVKELGFGKHKRLLTIDDVNDIRKKYILFRYGVRKLSKEYNICTSSIHKIVNNKSYIK